MSLITFNPPNHVKAMLPRGSRVVECLANEVHGVWYTHDEDGKPYEHEFDPGVSMYAIVGANGAHGILMIGERGQPVWEDL